MSDHDDLASPYVLMACRECNHKSFELRCSEGKTRSCRQTGCPGVMAVRAAEKPRRIVVLNRRTSE